MAAINDINIVTEDDDIDIELYNERILTMTTIPEGSIPGSRGLGLPMRFISKPPAAAINILAAELAEKIDRYLPEIQVVGVAGEATIDGELYVTIQIGRRTSQIDS